jgi:hypothetical protein
MNVSRSCYYAFLNRPESARSKRHKELMCEIAKRHVESFRRYYNLNNIFDNHNMIDNIRKT